MSNHEERALDYLCGWMREPTPRLIDDLAEQFRQVENATYERVLESLHQYEPAKGLAESVRSLLFAAKGHFMDRVRALIQEEE